MSTPRLFRYAGLTPAGEARRGDIRAKSRDDAADLLRAQGILPTSLRPRPNFQLRRAPPIAASAEGLEALAGLLSAGVPLPHALELLSGLLEVEWRRALPGIRSDVARGEPLSVALSTSALGLPRDILGLIEAGEASSLTAESLGRAAELLAFRAEAIQGVRDALAYPVTLVVAGGATVAFLVLRVLPQFAGLLTESGAAIPFTTRWVLASGAIGHVAFLPTAALLLIGLVLWVAWVGNPRGLLAWHRLLRKLPLIGQLRASHGTSTFCHALSGLLAGGSPLPWALTTAEAAVDDAAMRAALEEVQGRLSEGSSLASALECTHAVTPLAIRLVAIGEQTGRLSALLARAATMEQTHLRRRIKRATRILEPSLILVFGVIVAIVAASLLQAMYSFRPGP